MSSKAWDLWHHITGSTYGTWLPGDPRGHRTRHHREHAEGDYKNPPPKGASQHHHAHAQTLLKRPPVKLTMQARQLACDTMTEAFLYHNIDIAAIAVDATNYHILARFPDDNPRKFTGIAKKRSARAHPINDEQR